MNDQQTQLDPSVVALTKAIGTSESGGNYTAKGKSGEYGAYQYTAPTWSVDSQKYLGKAVPLEQATPAQQDEVAYKKIQDLGKQGYKPAQVASIWNSGKPEWEGNVGTNKYGVHFDTPAYVQSVGATYDKILKGQPIGVDPSNPSSVQQPGTPNSEGYITSANLPTPDATQQATSGPLGTNPNDSVVGKVLDNSITRGLVNIVPGAKTLGASIGTLGGLLYEKAKGALGGKDNSASYDTSAPSPLATTGAAIKTVGTAAGIEGAGSLLTGLATRGAALASEPIMATLTKYAGSDAVSSLSAAEKVEALTQAMSEGVGGNQVIFQKALQELAPQVLREAGVGSFAELNPATAKALGLTWKAVKFLAEVAVGADIYSKAKGLISKI